MYEEHPSFLPPASDAVLWRYMDFKGFVSLLDKKALFFARADKLGDPFEGSFPKKNIPQRLDAFKERFPDFPIGPHVNSFADFVRDSRKFTLINCWHESSHESAAMWKLYSGAEDGIAVKTCFKSFAESFTCEDRIFIGKVQYVDYDSELILEDNGLGPYLYKRHSFEHEKEVRAINLDLPIPSPITIENHIVDLSKPRHEVGDYREVDLSLLIEEVLVAPYAADWFLELAKSVARTYGMSATVNRSYLADYPVWV